METLDMKQAKRRLGDILQRAKNLGLPVRDVLSTKSAKKLLIRTKNAIIWGILLGSFMMVLSGFVYVRWPSHQEIETIKTVFPRSYGAAEASHEFTDRVAALLYTCSTQDDC